MARFPLGVTVGAVIDEGTAKERDAGIVKRGAVGVDWMKKEGMETLFSKPYCVGLRKFIFPIIPMFPEVR